jgi:hypothetical protein
MDNTDDGLREGGNGLSLRKWLTSRVSLITCTFSSHFKFSIRLYSTCNFDERATENMIVEVHPSGSQFYFLKI